jgi:UDP-galactopyranose mutase
LEKLDIVCFSHLRWNFVFQRPQHLLVRAALQQPVFYIEEPVFDSESPCYSASIGQDGVNVICMHLNPDVSPLLNEQHQRDLVRQVFHDYGIEDYILWFYTPMALSLAEDLSPRLVIYDCMDELSNFHGAPEGIVESERTLLRKADLVFAGGKSLYEARLGRNPDLHLFPSSVDAHFFGQARQPMDEPASQLPIPHPRLGFFGVIDERFDRDLVAKVAKARPDWHLIFVGPIVKIDPQALPQAANIHYLGAAAYQDLPAYISGWDVAILPFALNAATQYISPTKVPEYLAAGRKVVSTAIPDVVASYGNQGLVEIAHDSGEFVDAVERALAGGDSDWLRRVDAALASMSWDDTWQRMNEKIRARLMSRDGAVMEEAQTNV